MTDASNVSDEDRARGTAAEPVHVTDAVGEFEDAITESTGGGFAALLTDPANLVEDQFGGPPHSGATPGGVPDDTTPADVPDDTPDDTPDDVPDDLPDDAKLEGPPRQDPRE